MNHKIIASRSLFVRAYRRSPPSRHARRIRTRTVRHVNSADGLVHPRNLAGVEDSERGCVDVFDRKLSLQWMETEKSCQLALLELRRIRNQPPQSKSLVEVSDDLRPLRCLE